MIEKDKSTPEKRAFWKNIEKLARQEEIRTLGLTCPTCNGIGKVMSKKETKVIAENEDLLIEEDEDSIMISSKDGNPIEDKLEDLEKMFKHLFEGK